MEHNTDKGDKMMQTAIALAPVTIALAGIADPQVRAEVIAIFIEVYSRPSLKMDTVIVNTLPHAVDGLIAARNRAKMNEPDEENVHDDT